MSYSRFLKLRSMMVNMKMVLLFMLLLLLPACGTADYHLLFSSIDGLKKGAPLVFEQNTIGSVKTIVYTEQGEYLVTIAVNSDFTAAITEYSRFEVVPSPVGKWEKAIVMTLEQKGGTPLQKGSTIKVVPPSLFAPLEKMTPMLKKMERGFDTFVNDLKNIPESESFKALDNKIDELGRQMKDSGKEIQDNIRNNIIPRLEKALEELRRKFEQDGEPDKVEPLEKKLKDLQDV